MKYAEMGKRVRLARDAAGLNQKELADKVGCSQALISRLERGEHGATVETLSAIEEALNMIPGQLYPSTLMASESHERSLSVFLASPLAKALDPPLTDDEIFELKISKWFRRQDLPSPDDWYELVKLLRRVRSRKGSQR